MASLPRISPQSSVTLTLEPLTPSSFAPFGTVVTSPIPSDLTTIPPSSPPASHPSQQPPPQFANQQTALKTSPISPLINTYPASRPGTGLMSIFSCFPRLITTTTTATMSSQTDTPTLPIPILERHPYTTQTFCPFNFSLPRPEGGKTYFLVIVAPTTLSNSSPSSSSPPAVINPPSLLHLRAFYSPVTIDSPSSSSSPAGSAVTYNPGTWHAPMIVVGSRRVDFLVTQHANGVGRDDCQEVLIGGSDGDKGVRVDLSGLELSGGGVGGKAKL